MHLFKSQDEQNTPEYNGQESDVFVNTKRVGDQQGGTHKNEARIQQNKQRVNLSIIEETSENTCNGQSLMNGGELGETREALGGLEPRRFLGAVKETEGAKVGLMGQNRFSFNIKPIGIVIPEGRVSGVQKNVQAQEVSVKPVSAVPKLIPQIGMG